MTPSPVHPQNTDFTAPGQAQTPKFRHFLNINGSGTLHKTDKITPPGHPQNLFKYHPKPAQNHPDITRFLRFFTFQAFLGAKVGTLAITHHIFTLFWVPNPRSFPDLRPPENAQNVVTFNKFNFSALRTLPFSNCRCPKRVGKSPFFEFC